MTTKTVEELAYLYTEQLPIEAYSPNGGYLYYGHCVRDAYIAGYRACEEKLKAADGAYNLGYERASSRYRPIKIDPKDESTWPPVMIDVLGIEPIHGNWDVVYRYWMPLPKIEGEK